jgi:hypothetical protein
MYAMYYASMLRYWQLIRILVWINHCCLRVGCHRQFSPVWPQNRWRRVSRFGPQNRQLRFGDLSLKITATVSWFGPQNQMGFGLLFAP